MELMESPNASSMDWPAKSMSLILQETLVLTAQDDRNRPGYFIALGENRDEVDLKASTIKDLVHIRYAQQVAM